MAVVDDAGVIDVEGFVDPGPSVMRAADGSTVSSSGSVIAFLGAIIEVLWGAAGGSGASDVRSDGTVVEG
jgi:hypothetical protein